MLSIIIEGKSVRTIRRVQVEVRRTVSSGANGEVSLLDTLLAFSAFKDRCQTNQRPSMISRQCHWMSLGVLNLAILDDRFLHSDSLQLARLASCRETQHPSNHKCDHLSSWLINDGSMMRLQRISDHKTCELISWWSNALSSSRCQLGGNSNEVQCSRCILDQNENRSDRVPNLLEAMLGCRSRLVATHRAAKPRSARSTTSSPSWASGLLIAGG